MKKILIIAYIIIFTGCFDNQKLEGDKEVKKVEKIKKNEPKEIDVNKSIVTEVVASTEYTEKQLEVKESFKFYLNQLETLDTEGIISMTYPKLFVPINRTLFKQYVDSLLTSEQISVESFDTNITSIDFVQSYDKGEFVHLKYYYNIRLSFINPDLYNNELSIRILDNTLSRKYGKENISIEPELRTITIRKEEKLLGIKENNEDWKFIGDNQEYRRLYPQILPSDILSQI
jgi:hypothetical protein